MTQDTSLTIKCIGKVRNENLDDVLRFFTIFATVFSIVFFISFVTILADITGHITMVETVYLIILSIGFAVPVGILIRLNGKMNRVEKNLPVQPGFLFSCYDIFACSVESIRDRVNIMISRWNRYCKLRDVGYIEPLLNETQMHESLLSLREETARHVQAATALLQMEKEGDFKPQLTAPDDSLATSLEHVRELEDQIRRSLDGVEHRLHDPLSVAANVAALEKEMSQNFEDACHPKLTAARAMGRKLTNGS